MTQPPPAIKRAKDYPMQADEMPFKEFVAELARRNFLSWAGMYERLRYGKIKFEERRINGTVIYVKKESLKSLVKE